MINKTSRSHHKVFDLRHFICVVNTQHASIFVQELNCESLYWAVMDLWGHAGLC